MNIVKVEPQVDPSRFIVITRQTDIDETISNRVFVTDNISNSANIIEISRGIQGFTGPKGADGVVFDILPIISGGTNNSTFEAGKIVYYDGAKLVSSEYDIANILTEGVLAGSGLIKVESNGNLTLHTNLGSGLYLDNNKIAVNFDAIDDRILQQIDITAGSGLLFNSDTSTYHIGSSNDILVNNDNIELTPTGIAGTYSKVTTDNKGRVVSGSSLTSNEIESLLGYIPWRANNDGDNSGLDADKLDSYHASFFRNANNLTGLLNTNTIKIGDPNQTVTKLVLDSNGAISSVTSLSDNDISQILGYVPANKNGDTLTGSFNINSSIFDSNGVKLNDNLPILAGNHYSLAYNDLRGFRFLYGGNPNLPKTGIFGYDYGSDQLKLIVEDTTHIILSQSVAHQLYAALGSSNTFSGVNTFLTNTFAQHIYVTGLSINTTGLIQNLNSQYLNFKNSDYYSNASNLTGILNASGFPVVVNNISGSVGYIPLFDNRTSVPSRTISDSIISQDDKIIKINDGNLLIGSSNAIESGVTDAAIIAGHNNNMSGTISGFIFGNNNLIGSDIINSTIIGNNATSRHNNTVLLGKDGVTWSDNQTIFGMFKEPSTNDSADGQGQYTSIGLSYYGQASNYTNLEPNNKYIPKHKTILFNSDVIINRLGVSGTAVFRFESGVIRNVTKPIDGNALFAENQCFFLKEPVKKVIFNDTYIRDYLTYLDLEDNPSAQKFTNIKVTDNTINSPFSTDVQNVDNNVIINPKPISLSGSFEWQEYPHTLNLYLDKPLVSGYYYIDDTDAYLIDIYTYDHQAITGSTLNIQFNNNIIPDGRYIVQSIIDDHKLKVYKPFDKAVVSSFVDNGSSYDIDLQFETPFTDYYSNSSKIYVKYLNTNFDISDLYSNVSYTINQNIVTASLTNLNKNSFLINDLPFPTGCVEVLPVLTNMSGYCFVNPKSNFVQTFDYMLAKTTNVNRIPVPLYDTGENYISSSLYRPSKAFYIQEPSDTDGYSKITISGINFSNDPQALYEKYRLGLNPWFQLKGNTSYKDQDFYNLFGHVDGGAFHIAKSSGVSFYAKFANYINANYLYVHDYYEYLSGILPGEATYFDGHPVVSGFVLNIKHLDLKGDTSVSGLMLLPSQPSEERPNIPDADLSLSNIFIDRINDESVGIYVNTSGYRYYSEGAPPFTTKTADTPIFIPYSLGDLSVSGTIRIVESGSYKSGNHPLNKNIYPFNIVYNENKPVYFPQTQSYWLAGDPEFSFVTYIKYDHPNSGHVVSGYVDVYATPIAVDEKISFSTNNITTNRNMLGSTIDLIDNGSFDIKRGKEYSVFGTTDILIIEREFFYPTEYVSNFSGLVSIDRNHNLKIGSSSEYSYIPVVFDNNNYFDNGIFEITTIDDNKITLDNSKNILRYNPDKKFNRDDQYRVSYSSGVGAFSGTPENSQAASGFFFDLFDNCDRGAFDNKNHLDQNDKIKIINYLPTGYNSAQQINQIFEVYNDSVTNFFYPNPDLPINPEQNLYVNIVANSAEFPYYDGDPTFFDIRFACNQNHSSSNFVFPTGFQGTYGKFYVVDINGCDQSQYVLEATTIDSPLYLNAGDLMSIGPVVENQPYYITISGYLWNTTPRIDPYFEKTFTFTFSGNYDPSYRDLYITQPLLIDNKYANSSTDSHSLGYIYVAKSGDDDGPLGPGYTPQYNFIFSNIYGSNNNDEFKISNDKQLLYTKTFEYDTIDLSNNIKYVEILAQHTNIPSDRFVKKFGISGILAPNYIYKNLQDQSLSTTSGITVSGSCLPDFTECTETTNYAINSEAILEESYLTYDKYLTVIYQNYDISNITTTTIMPYAVLNSGSDYYMGYWYNTTGLISWTHYASGNCYIPQNLIPFNTDINYQNFYNRWGLNATGLLVKDLVSSSKYEMSVAAGCEPDAVCIKIDNISNDAYNAISENDKVYLSFDYPNQALSSGFIVNQKDNSESKNSLYLRPRKSSLSTAVSDHCGYVTVTPFYDTNAVTNKNPNYNGSFINPTINSLGVVNETENALVAITGQHLTLFDNFTNRYIHNIEIQNTGIYINNKGLVISDVPAITGYNLRLSTLNQNNFSAKNFHILYNSRDPISISSISYRYADPLDGWKPSSFYDYNLAEFEECTSSLSLYNNTPFELQIKTEYGIYSDSTLAAPQISIFGVREYSVIDKTFVKYDESINQGYWLLTVRCEPFTLTDNRNITVFVKDTTRYDSKSLSITISPRLVVKDATQIFSDGKIIHIYGVSSTDNIANLGISGTSYNPSFLLWDSILQAWTVPLDAYSSIDVTYLDQIQTIQAEPTTLTNPYIRIANLIDSGDPIVFKTNCNNYIIDVLYLAPPDLSGEPNLSVTGSATVVSTSYSSSFSGRKYIFRVTLNKEIMTNGTYGCTITVTHTSSLSASIPKNIVVSLPLFVDTGYLFQPIKVNDTSPWIVDFKINSASGYLPSITLSNTPSFTYKLGTVYSSGLDQYQVTATGYKDYLFDDQYFTSYGVKNLLIYIDDKYSYNSGTIRLDLTKYNDIYNLQSETYAFYNKTANIILDTDYIDKDITKNNDVSDIQTSFTFDKKYNPNYNQYSHKITTTPIDYIYDAVVEIENEQFSAPLENIFVADALDDDYSVYKLNLKAKGILNDRIYSVGKIDTLEVKNDFKIIKPLEISNIEPDPLSTSSLQGGAKWTLKFNVCYGIAQEEYRPLIVLSGMPTSCTGLLSEYVEPDTPSLCYKNSEFDNSTKCWTFEFEGVPNCDLNNIIFPIVIKAYDTFDNGSTVVDSDTKTTTIRYGQLPINPPPTLTIESTSSNVYPNCSFVSYPWSGLVGTRSVCPVITGLYRLSLFGYLPSGLNINFDSIIDFDGNSTTPSIGNHYLLDTGNGIHDYGSGFYYTATIIPDNISGIVGTINGTITEFFEGTKTLSGILTNRIDDTTATEVSFLDNSNALTNPVQYGVLFFDSDQPVFIEENNGISTNGIRTIVNPPDALSLQKHGRFHEQNGFYSGVYSTFDQDNAILSISGINRPVSQNNLVLYSPFTPDLYYDSVYIDLGSSKVLAPIAEWVSPNSIKIVAQRSFVNPNSPLPCSFVIPKITDRLGNFNGPLPDLSINSDTNGNLLGCGTYDSDGSIGKIYGKLRPAYRGYIYNSGVQIPYPIRDNERIDQLFNTISVEGIDGICCDSAQSSVYLTNCYETGIIKISGIVVPKPSLEVTDIPELLYKFASQNLSLRLAYGYTDEQKQLPDNIRDISFAAPVTDTLYKINKFDEELVIDRESFNINIGSDDGSLFRLNLQMPQSESFPTSNQYAIPSLKNNQYFAYAGLTANEDHNLTSLSRNSFSPFVPIVEAYFGFASGQTVSGFVMGGFYPAERYTINNQPNPIVNDTAQYTGYPPKISGILSSGYYNQYDGIYSINQGIILAYTNNIDINNIATGVGDYLAIFSSPLTTGILVEATGIYEFNGNYKVGVSGNTTYTGPNIDNSGCIIQKCVTYELDNMNFKIILDKPYEEININDQINIKPLNNYDSQNIIGITGTITTNQINGNKLICDTNAYDVLSEYYDISGFATVDRIVSSSGLATILSRSNARRLLWNVLVSGVSGESLSHLDKDYKYHLISQDNPDMPVFNALSWSVTHGARTYPLHMIKNFEIYSIGDTNNPATVLYRTYSGITWSVSFYVANGKRPLRYNYPYIDLKNSCNFTYSISYNDVLDMLLVEASSTDTQPTPCIRVYNDLGHSTEINVS